MYIKNERRLILSVELLMRSVSVEIDSIAVEPVMYQKPYWRPPSNVIRLASDRMKRQLKNELLEENVKTGTDAMKSGLYVSECCEEELTFDRHQTLTRCPKCCGLTTWELIDTDALKAA